MVAASRLFCEHLSQNHRFERQIREQLHKPAVLLLQLLQYRGDLRFGQLALLHSPLLPLEGCQASTREQFSFVQFSERMQGKLSPTPTASRLAVYRDSCAKAV